MKTLKITAKITAGLLTFISFVIYNVFTDQSVGGFLDILFFLVSFGVFMFLIDLLFTKIFGRKYKIEEEKSDENNENDDK